jgi:hypothetical protein
MKNMKQDKIKESLVALGHSFEEIYSGIFLIKNFFTEKDVLPLWEIINNATQKDWEEDYYNSQKSLALRKYDRDDLENLIEEGLMEYTYAWADKAIAVPENTVFEINKKIAKIFEFDNNFHYGNIDTIQRQYEGAPLIEHVDSHGDPRVLFAVIGYLNDDYTNGELFFSKLGIKLKPPANSLIIFPDGENYMHGVMAPGPGPLRYALPTFVTKNGESMPSHQE